MLKGFAAGSGEKCAVSVDNIISCQDSDIELGFRDLLLLRPKLMNSKCKLGRQGGRPNGLGTYTP